MLKKLATWFKELFAYPPELLEMQRRAMETNKIYQQALDKAKPKKRPRLYKQATVVTKGELPAPKKTPAKKVAVKTVKKLVAKKTIKKSK
jgi:hypothetical protein